MNQKESSKATSIESNKEFISKSELSFKPIDHEDTTISAPLRKANGYQIDSTGNCLGIQKTDSNHPNMKHEIEWQRKRKRWPMKRQGKAT